MLTSFLIGLIYDTEYPPNAPETGSLHSSTVSSSRSRVMTFLVDTQHLVVEAVAVAVQSKAFMTGTRHIDKRSSEE
jgi:hypothetical protein